MKYTINILLVVCTLSLFGQTEGQPAASEAGLVFYDVRVGFNAIRAGRTFFGSGTETQELQATLGVNQFDVNVDYGTEKNTIRSNYTYVNDGDYIRIGVDRNFVRNRTSGNAISLGLRYAWTNFEDKLEYTLNNGFGEQDISVSNEDLRSRWFELVFNLRGKVVSNLYMGFTMRWQFANQLKGEGQLKTYFIPGFGDVKRDNSTAFDYYIMWRIPFKK